MAIQELPVPNFITLNASVGMIGLRKWVVTCGEDLAAFIGRVCTSGWPGRDDVVLMQLTVGPFDEHLKCRGGGDLDQLMQYKETLVTAQYQFVPMHNCWPVSTPKPKHPKGSVLRMKIRGSGQFLLVPPGALRSSSKAQDAPKKQPAFGQSDNCRLLVPITEYHLSCDRLTREQYDAINPKKKRGSAIPWSEREGSVNKAEFLGEPPETLLFDSWEEDQVMVPDPIDPVRYKLSAVIRCRQVTDANGRAADLQGKVIGWNHDYRVENGKGGWQYVWMLDDLGGKGDRPRYPIMEFSGIFCDSCCPAAASRRRRASIEYQTCKDPTLPFLGGSYPCESSSSGSSPGSSSSVGSSGSSSSRGGSSSSKSSGSSGSSKSSSSRSSSRASSSSSGSSSSASSNGTSSSQSTSSRASGSRSGSSGTMSSPSSASRSSGGLSSGGQSSGGNGSTSQPGCTA